MSTLESEVANIKVTLAEMKAQAAADQEHLVSLLTQSKEGEHHEKSLGKPNHGKEEASSHGSGEVKKLLQQLQGDALDEFKQSVEKVKLPMFDGDDLAAWIA